MPYWLFLKERQNLKLSSAANIGGALRVKDHSNGTIKGIKVKNDKLLLAVSDP